MLNPDPPQPANRMAAGDGIRYHRADALVDRDLWRTAGQHPGISGGSRTAGRRRPVPAGETDHLGVPPVRNRRMERHDLAVDRSEKTTLRKTHRHRPGPGNCRRGRLHPAQFLRERHVESLFDLGHPARRERHHRRGHPPAPVFPARRMATAAVPPERISSPAAGPSAPATAHRPQGHALRRDPHGTAGRPGDDDGFGRLG